MVYYRTQNTYI